MANIIQIKRKTGVEGGQLEAAEPALRDLTGGAGELYIGNLAGDDNILIGASNVARLTGAAFSGSVTLDGSQTTDNHAATIEYIDSLAAGTREIKNSVALTTDPANPLISLSAYDHISATILRKSTDGAFPATDGFTLAHDERILLKDEATGGDAHDNGIYTLTDAGGAGSKWELTRADDSDTAEENKKGQFCFVDAGTLNNKTGWLQTSADVVTLGADPITFAKVSGTSLVTPDNTTLVKDVTGADELSVKAAGIGVDQIAAAALGNGLTGGNGTAISVDVDDSTLAISGGALAIKAGGVTETQLSTTVVADNNGFVDGVGAGTPLAIGEGTGITVGADSIALNFGATAGTALEGDAAVSGGTWA
jgi:hypothetical protein